MATLPVTITLSRNPKLKKHQAAFIAMYKKTKPLFALGKELSMSPKPADRKKAQEIMHQLNATKAKAYLAFENTLVKQGLIPDGVKVQIKFTPNGKFARATVSEYEEGTSLEEMLQSLAGQ